MNNEKAKEIHIQEREFSQWVSYMGCRLHSEAIHVFYIPYEMLRKINPKYQMTQGIPFPLEKLAQLLFFILVH